MLHQFVGPEHLFFASSGRVALSLILRALQQVSSRREVVIPAYTCFSVPSAVVRSGLLIRLCDVDAKNLDLDQNALLRLDLEKTLCIVPSGLYGMPADLEPLGKVARACGAFLVDDAAQCLGAKIGRKPCGTFGDAGFFSLGRGKNITTMGGGILVTGSKDLAQLIRKEINKLPRSSSLGILSVTLNSLLYAIMLPPSRYWILDRIPFLGLGISRFDPNFAMAPLSRYQGRLAVQLFPLLDSYNQIRRHNADQLRAGIEQVEGIEIPRPVEGANPVYIRFPILASNGTHRSRLLKRLREVGIAASASYPRAVADIPGVRQYLASDQQDCPQARSIAERIITLPTHPHVTPADIDKMIGIVRAES
jgi:dTDP-4-amino-4,6-dideoxygalactose transaminase